VETVSEPWPGQDHHCDEVANEAEAADHADEEAIAIVLEVDHGGVLGEVEATISADRSPTHIETHIEHVLPPLPNKRIKTVTFQAF